MQTHLVLKKYLRKKKKSVAGFSLRRLAEEMGLSASFLSRVFSGEKPVPYALLLRLKDTLDIEPEVFASLREAHQIPLAGARAPRRGKAEVETSLQDWELTDDQSLSALRQWFYLPILEFVTLKNYDGSSAQIARRLNLSVTAVDIALEELTSLGLLKKESGRFKKTKKKMRWGSAKSLREVRRFHDQMLGKAQEVLRTQTEEADFRRRLITGITLTASPEKIEEAKKKLAECLHEIANDLTEEEGTEVYHLAMQLIPLTK
jgi:uncharacterized protein (TIGR02147 family)